MIFSLFNSWSPFSLLLSYHQGLQVNRVILLSRFSYCQIEGNFYFLLFFFFLFLLAFIRFIVLHFLLSFSCLLLCLLAVTCVSEKSKRRTRTQMMTNDPKWNQTFVYSPLRRSDLKTRALELALWDYDRYGCSEFLGEVLIELATAPLDDEPEWYLLGTHEETLAQLVCFTLVPVIALIYSSHTL